MKIKMWRAKQEESGAPMMPTPQLPTEAPTSMLRNTQNDGAEAQMGIGG